MTFKIRKVLQKVTLALALTLSMCALLASTPALAITNGQPDENDHPYVCSILMIDDTGEISMMGSGILIAPNIVLTAGHVTAAGAYALVSFDPAITEDSQYIPGQPFVHPGFQYYYEPGLHGTLTHDTGIIALAANVTLPEYGVLPDMGMIDTLPHKTSLDIVGYGANYLDHPSGEWVYLFERYQAVSELIKADDEFIKCTANPSQGKGGSSYGDSGGPVLLKDTNIIAGLVSYGPNPNCTGVEYESRIDTPDILNWIMAFLY